MVYAIVTLPKSGNGSRRLFLCTKDPEGIGLDYKNCADDAIREYGRKTSITSRWPATCSTGTLRYRTMKARISCHWKIVVEFLEKICKKYLTRMVIYILF